MAPESRDRYTVGWIAALPLELAAATAMLDEEHPRPVDFEKPPADQNAYTWGRISGHNVVIASLPAGVYGETSAAATAMSMIHSFPYIRVGLMVGIGAAISRPGQGRDIRLGDVIVSQPDGRTGGVLQYDLRKAKPGGKQELKGSLNMPPQVLLTALAKLQALHERLPSKVPNFLEEMVKSNPQMAKSKPRKASYLYQGNENDRLFKAEYGHVDGFNCKDCDSQQEVSRENRDSNEPEIHYGIIASGNTLVKDAATRDLILQATREDCICLEMEAAGLMNNFPCLVIRGICDYADSHKNDRWQRYAAATAAAYAKEFLEVVPVEDLEKTQNAVDVLKEVIKVKEKLNDIDNATKETINSLHRLRLNSQQQKVIEWLSPPDPSTNYARALGQRHEGSGEWFLQSAELAEWKTMSNSFLWLYGILGCGKTILSATIIEELGKSTSRSQLLYFYFDFNDTSKQPLEEMVRSLIFQLYEMREDTRKQLDSLFSSCKGRQPTSESLCASLLHMIQQVGEVYIILDALDECSTRGGAKGLLSWMKSLLSPERKHVHLLVTSRPEEDIKSSLNGIGRQVPIQGDLVDRDIYAYIHARIREDDGLKRWRSRPDVQEKIETQLKEQSKGMFRWTACQLDALERCFDPQMLQHALGSLPETLDETYDRILLGIPRASKQKAIRILQFLAFSERPLRVEEAVDAIIVEPEGNPRFDPSNRMPDPMEISKYCSSLVVVGNRQLQLAHFSVKEYLVSNRLPKHYRQSFQETEAKALIVSVCIAYLLHLDQDLPVEEIKASFYFAHYCAQYWIHHAAAATKGNDKVFQNFLIEFFLDRKWSYTNCYRLYCPDQPWNDDPAKDIPVPIYYASLGGLQDVVQCLIERGDDINAQGGYYGSALQAASDRGHENIVQILLDKGADVNAQGGLYGNALQAASAIGHENIVHMLLDKGADVNAQGGYYGNALQAASDKGHKNIVHMLLDKSADINAQGGEYGNALYAASAEGHENIVQMLLDKGANINAQGGLYGNALQAASDKGHKIIVQMLLDKSADANAHGGLYSNALHAASDGGHKSIVHMLLDKGADVNAQGGYYGNALQAASAKGHESIVHMLLDKSADANARGGRYGNALQAASAKGHENIVHMLLDKGADVNAQSGEYGNALQAASAIGHGNIVHMLLDKGADVNAIGKRYSNALQAASAEGHENIVQMLLGKCADANTQGGYYGNALYAASDRGHENIVQMLLDKGANANTQGGYYGNALYAASDRGHENIVQMLLDKGANVNAQGGLYGNALRAASAEGHENIVHMLLGKGADANTQGGEYGNALYAASDRGHKNIVQMLLDKGADVNGQGGLYGNALQAASAKGYKNIVQMLLDKGADVNTQGGLYGNTLQAASAKGHESIVHMLLDKGADVNAQGGEYGNALHAASAEGHENIVHRLLDKGADVNAQSGEYGNALQAASAEGHKNIVHMLLDKSADVNAQGGLYGNALQAASAKGHKNIVQMLLDKSADANAQSEEYGNALHAASAEGHENIVQMLLDKGADVNAQSGENGNALHAASAEGHENIVHMLLDKGTDVNAQGGYYGNALQAASVKGYENIVQILLDKGADANARGGRYGNPLQAASAKGHENIVQILLDKSADVNAQGGKYSNALQAASAKGYKNIVQMLLDKSVDVNAQGGEYSNALQAAFDKGHKDIVQMLLDKGAGVKKVSRY